MPTIRRKVAIACCSSPPRICAAPSVSSTRKSVGSAVAACWATFKASLFSRLLLSKTTSFRRGSGSLGEALMASCKIPRNSSNPAPPRTRISNSARWANMLRGSFWMTAANRFAASCGLRSMTSSAARLTVAAKSLASSCSALSNAARAPAMSLRAKLSRPRNSSTWPLLGRFRAMTSRACSAAAYSRRSSRALKVAMSTKTSGDFAEIKLNCSNADPGEPRAICVNASEVWTRASSGDCCAALRKKPSAAAPSPWRSMASPARPRMSLSGRGLASSGRSTCIALDGWLERK